jgi:shikimate kinase
MPDPGTRPIRHLAVVGLMGTGKTTVGRILARRLGWPMRDSDEEIEALTGKTVREHREVLGTDGMHDLEARALLHALGGEGPDVVGAAASTVDREDCRNALRGIGVAVVWLTASPAVAAQRFLSSSHRPWYGDDPATFLARQAREREPQFRALDAVQIDTDERDPEAVAEAALAALRGRGWSLAPG